MISTFIDSSFFLALTLTDDELHSRAIAWQNAVTGKLITTEFVLLEVADGLIQPRVRHYAAGNFAAVKRDPLMTILPLNSEYFYAGVELFLQSSNKHWSLTDCISFKIMREFGLTDALTHDHHFEQAGFRALLREDPPNN